MALTEVRPPAGFEAAWSILLDHDVDARAWFSAEGLEMAAAIAVLLDPADSAQLARLRRLVATVDAAGVLAPPTLCVLVAADGAEPDPDPVHALLSEGLDDVVCGQPSGLELALAVRGSVARLEACAEAVNRELRSRATATEQASDLRLQIHDALWGYCRRAATSIPPVGHNIRLENGRVAGFTLGQRLGSGAFGTVFEARPTGASGPAEVIKVVEKNPAMGLKDLMRVNAGIKAMEALSSDTWQHPGIVRMLGMFHTPTHLFFRMEHGGLENLDHRIRDCDKDGADRRAMPTAMLLSIAAQITSTVAHMHEGPGVCHRDIKPANIIVHQEGSSVTVKLADFDFACNQTPGKRCHSRCGTVPFMAPEVGLEQVYDGFAADVFSTGVVLLELLCNRCILEQNLDLRGGAADRELARRLQVAFDNTGLAAKLLRENCRCEARPLLAALEPACDGALEAMAANRWPAARLHAVLAQEMACGRRTFERQRVLSPATGAGDAADVAAPSMGGHGGCTVPSPCIPCPPRRRPFHFSSLLPDRAAPAWPNIPLMRRYVNGQATCTATRCPPPPCPPPLPRSSPHATVRGVEHPR